MGPFQKKCADEKEDKKPGDSAGIKQPRSSSSRAMRGRMWHPQFESTASDKWALGIVVGIHKTPICKHVPMRFATYFPRFREVLFCGANVLFCGANFGSQNMCRDFDTRRPAIRASSNG
jgi:hypothetical protein